MDPVVVAFAVVAIVAGAQPAMTREECVARIRPVLAGIEAQAPARRPGAVLEVVAESCALIRAEVRAAAREAAPLKRERRAQSLLAAAARLGGGGGAGGAIPGFGPLEPALRADLDQGTLAFAIVLAGELSRTGLMEKIGVRLVGELILGTALENRAARMRR